jgi:hypothetical protein
MPDELDIIYAFKFTPSNNGHEKNGAINSCVFVDIAFLFTTRCKN